MLDIYGNELNVDDKVLYSNTHGHLQAGRILSIEDGVMKVIGVGKKREMAIKDSTLQIFLLHRAFYIKNPRRHA